MSVLFRRAHKRAQTAGELIAERSTRTSGMGPVTSEEAMRSSAVWACLRLRADLVSTSPVDVYRQVGPRAIAVETPPVLVNPGGSKVDICEWLYSTQVDLDRFGNTVGLITARDGAGFPARIDLQVMETVTVKTSNGAIVKFKIGGREYDPLDVWHEKQHTVAGVPVGLSPLAHAAMSLRSYINAQQFTAEWFAGGAVPSSHLKNTDKTLDKDQAQEVKARFKQSVANGDVFVTGSDWSYEMLGGKASESAFLESMNADEQDICRYLGVPGDMIDLPPEGGGSITYANITQRNLQLLIVNMGPALTRRQRALSTLVSPPRFVKLNADAVVLRMDPATRAEMNKVLVDSGQRTLTEVREKDDLAPLEDQTARTVEERSDALGSLVRAGFDPESAAAALGLPKIAHSGAVPITVSFDTKGQGQPDAGPGAVNITTPPVTIDARSTIHVPSINIPPAEVTVDARSTHAPPEVTVNVEAPVVHIDPPPPTRRIIDRDEGGRIVGVTEEPAP